jgi:hypothetical protein
MADRLRSSASKAEASSVLLQIKKSVERMLGFLLGALNGAIRK